MNQRSLQRSQVGKAAGNVERDPINCLDAGAGGIKNQIAVSGRQQNSSRLTIDASEQVDIARCAKDDSALIESATHRRQVASSRGQVTGQAKWNGFIRSQGSRDHGQLGGRAIDAQLQDALAAQLKPVDSSGVGRQGSVDGESDLNAIGSNPTLVGGHGDLCAGWQHDGACGGNRINATGEYGRLHMINPAAIIAAE